MDASECLAGVRLMPVVTVEDGDSAVALAEALCAGGQPAMEITLRTVAGFAAIEEVARRVPEMLVGAGSLRDPADFQRLAAVGCRFAVSPGFAPPLLDAATLPYLPGAATAAESLQLLAAGYRLQKFFPARLAGGQAMLRALSAPLPEVRYCPTGGIGLDEAAEYLALDCVSCVGGSWFALPPRPEASFFATVERQVADALARLAASAP